MLEEIKNHMQAMHSSRLWISLTVWLMLLVGLIGLGGCSKNSANRSAATVVKNSIGMEFASVPAGSFKMGLDSYTDESPVHQVTFASGFYMGRYEVTQAQWQKVMGSILHLIEAAVRTALSRRFHGMTLRSSSRS
jgi:formylglycine-generating enzyme required for sulfatase activity